VRDLQRAGTPVFEKIVEHFGPDMVASDGELDRAGLAEVVFANPSAREDLNAIVHPAVWEAISAELDRLRDSDAVVVLDVPLLAEAGTGFTGAVIVVTAPDDVRVERVTAARGLSADEVRARIAAQASDAERAAIADHVVDNAGDRDALAAKVDSLWAELTQR